MATLLDTLAANEEFTIFTALVRKTAIVDMLKEPGPYTVFAPIDDAFDNLPEGAVNRLMQDSGKLSAVVAYHVVPGKFTIEDAARLSSSVTTIEGGDLRVAALPTALTVNGAPVIRPDLVADNGVLHGIDQVLVPLNDLGSVVMEYEDVVVVAPETMIVMTPPAPPSNDTTPPSTKVASGSGTSEQPHTAQNKRD